MNLVMRLRKPVFGVTEQIALKPACVAMEASKSLKKSDLETVEVRILGIEKQ